MVAVVVVSCCGGSSGSGIATGGAGRV